jgi:hypothetical protein
MSDSSSVSEDDIHNLKHFGGYGDGDGRNFGDDYVVDNDDVNRVESERRRLDANFLRAKEDYDHGTQLIFDAHIRRFTQLVKAVDYARNTRSRPGMAVFAKDKPKRNKNRPTGVSFVKEYLVGTYLNFWKYCQTLDNGVLLDECLRSDIPLPLHFDVEIKLLKEEDHPLVDLADILKRQCALANIDMSPTEVCRVAAQYKEHSMTDITEDECRAGLLIMLEFIGKFLQANLSENTITRPRFRVVSGCRSSKLSFHIVSKPYVSALLYWMAIIHPDFVTVL